MLGKLLRQVVVVILDAHSDGDEPERIAAVVVASRLQYGEGVGGIHVGHAVGHQDDAVVGTGVRAACLVGKLPTPVEACLHVGGTVGIELADGACHSGIIRGPVVYCVLAEDIGAEMHHGNTVVTAQAAPDGLSCFTRDGDAIPNVHGAGSIQHQGYVDRRGIVVHLRGLKGDAGHVHPAFQRMPEDIAGNREAVIAQRRVILVVESVNPLPRPHRVWLHLVSCPGPVEGQVVGGPVCVKERRRQPWTRTVL